MEDFKGYLNNVLEIIIEHGLNILMAIVVLIIGLSIVKFITKKFKRTLEKRNVDESLKSSIKLIFVR